MNPIIKNGATSPQCHPRRLKVVLENCLKQLDSNKKSKRERILFWLVTSSCDGCKVTRFDAEWVNDHVLNTTISEIQRFDGITVERERTKIPNKFGGMTSCSRYWLDAENVVKAKKFLGIS